MKNRFRKTGIWFLAMVMVLAALTGCVGTGEPSGSQPDEVRVTSTAAETSEAELNETQSHMQADGLDEQGTYTSKDEVALYIHLFHHLPENYITKKDAQNLGWDSKGGNLWDVAPGKSIGGSGFGNYEGLLPEQKGRKYYECDIDYEGGYRGAKRLVYSNDGLIFYTEDHYKSFEQLY